MIKLSKKFSETSEVWSLDMGSWQGIILEIIPYDDLDTEEWGFFFSVGGGAALKDKLSRMRSPWSFGGLPVVSGLVHKCKDISTK